MASNNFLKNVKNNNIYNVIEQFLQFYEIKYCCIIMMKKYAK